MKRIFLPLLLIVSFVCCFTVQFFAAQYINSAASPIIDGNIDDIWYEQPLNYINMPISGAETVSADYRMVWNNTIVYLLVRVFDTDIASSGGYGERDGVTFWFNPSNEREGDVFKIMITAPADSGIRIEGPEYDLTLFDRTAKKAYVKTDYGYMIEASFDLASLYSGFDASSGPSIGFDIWITDNGAGVQNVLSWCGYHGDAASVLKDTVSFMTASVPDDDGQDNDDGNPGTDDDGIIYEAFALFSLLGMAVAAAYGKIKEKL